MGEVPPFPFPGRSTLMQKLSIAPLSPDGPVMDLSSPLFRFTSEPLLPLPNADAPALHCIVQ